MASTTSLLKSAASTKKKILQQEDALVAFDWQNSAQTYEDFQDYSQYLQKRQGEVTDQSQKLTYAKTQVSARRSYTSNELQRQQMAIMEGRGTTQDKMNSVYSLYQQAVDNNDYNLAQNLASQYDSLSIRLQNEAEAAQRTAGSLAMNGVKTLDALIRKATKGDELIELADGTVIKPIDMLNKELNATGTSDNGQFFKEVYDTISAIQGAIADAYNGASTQEAVDAIESKYGGYINGEKKFKVAGMDLTPQDVELAYRSALANNPLYSPQEVRNETTGELEFKLKKNAVDDFTWIRNDDGTYQAVQTRAKVLSPYQDLNSRITNEGYFLGATDKTGVSNIGTGEQVKSSSAASIKERLQQQGITASQNSDGTLDLVLPSGEQVKGAVQPDGSIRYFGAPGDFSGGQAGLYEINIFDGSKREVAPDEASIFGQQSVFGGQISKASDAGTRVIQALSGITRPPDNLLSPLAKIANPGINDFSGTGIPLATRNLQGTTSVLQSAANTRDLLQAQEQQRLQAEATANRLQQAQVFNLNQTPIQQFAQNGAPIRQLTVAKPTSVPKLSVGAPTPTPVITSVGNATPGRITGVSVSAPQPRVVVR